MKNANWILKYLLVKNTEPCLISDEVEIQIYDCTGKAPFVIVPILDRLSSVTLVRFQVFGRPVVSKELLQNSSGV